MMNMSQSYRKLNLLLTRETSEKLAGKRILTDDKNRALSFLQKTLYGYSEENVQGILGGTSCTPVAA